MKCTKRLNKICLIINSEVEPASSFHSILSKDNNFRTNRNFRGNSIFRGNGNFRTNGNFRGHNNFRGNGTSNNEDFQNNIKAEILIILVILEIRDVTI
jgi:hypothetical protein